MLVVACTATPAQAQVVVAPYIDTNVAGDVETGRGGLGASAGYYLLRRGRSDDRVHGRLGFELDVELHSHFFRDEDVADLVPEGVDLDTDATLFMGNVVAPLCVQGAAGSWCPYGTAGLGVIHAVFDGFVFDRDADQEEFDTDQYNLAFNGGVGVMHALTRLVGLRVDVRYFHALVDEDADKGGYFRDYDFCRVSAGVTFGFPRVRPEANDPVGATRF